MNVVCKQPRARDNRVGEKPFAKENVGKVGGHKICYGILDALVGQVAPDASDGGVLLIISGEANDNCG